MSLSKIILYGFKNSCGDECEDAHEDDSESEPLELPVRNFIDTLWYIPIWLHDVKHTPDKTEHFKIQILVRKCILSLILFDFFFLP